MVSRHCCVSPEGLQWTVYLHRYVGERFWSSCLLFGWPGGRFKVRSRSHPTELSIWCKRAWRAKCLSWAWLYDQRDCCSFWRLWTNMVVAQLSQSYWYSHATLSQEYASGTSCGWTTGPGVGGKYSPRLGHNFRGDGVTQHVNKQRKEKKPGKRRMSLA